MGCCENRNSSNTADISTHLTSKGQILKKPNIHQESNRSTQNQSQDPWQRAVSLSKKQKNCSWLLEFLADYTPQFNVHPYPRWSEQPATRACAALALMNRKLRKKTIQFDSQLLSDKTELICRIIHSGKTDIRNHIIFFLSQVLRKKNEEIVQKFLGVGIFKALNKWLICEGFQQRYYTAMVCWLLYKGQDEAKEKFVAEQGIQYLIIQIANGVFTGVFFKDLIVCLKDLILDGKGVNYRYIDMIRAELDESILMKIDITFMVEETREEFDKLITILSL